MPQTRRTKAPRSSFPCLLTGRCDARTLPNHWRSLAFENEDFYLHNVYFAPDPGSVADANSANGDLSLGSVDVGESTVKGTVVYLASVGSADVNVWPRPGFTAV